MTGLEETTTTERKPKSVMNELQRKSIKERPREYWCNSCGCYVGFGVLKDVARLVRAHRKKRGCSTTKVHAHWHDEEGHYSWTMDLRIKKEKQ